MLCTICQHLHQVCYIIQVAEDNLAHQKMIMDKVKGSLDSAPKDDGTLYNKRKELQKDVEQTKRALSQQVSVYTQIVSVSTVMYICIYSYINVYL